MIFRPYPLKGVCWDSTDPEDIRQLQKYAESDGSIAYLQSTLVKNLIGLWDFMNLLIKQDRPDDENITSYTISWMNNGPI